jgi:secreted PhoX family phosphatase
MTGMSRRRFLSNSAGVAAGAALATTALADAAGATATSAAGAERTTGSIGGVAAGHDRKPQVANGTVIYVRNAATSEVVIMSGETEVVVNDRDLIKVVARHNRTKKG